MGASRTFDVIDAERAACVMAGAGLALYGALRRDKAGFALAVVGTALAIRGARGHSLLHDLLGMRRFAGAGSAQNAVQGSGVRVERSISIDRPVETVYRYWRNFENLPRFMEHLVSVRPTGLGRYRWEAKAPVGTVTWDAEIIEEQVPWLISWRSVEGSGIENAGSVRFSPAPDGRGTEVRVELAYKPPAGAVGALFARMRGEEPSLQVRDDLQRFKWIMENEAAGTV